VNAAELASALGCSIGPRRSSRGLTYRVKCPAHPDRNPSLDITDADGTILLACRAGCRNREDLIPKLIDMGHWKARSGQISSRAIGVDWAAHLTIDAPKVPPCCLRGPESGEPTCEHWRAFDAEMAIARLHTNLHEAANEVVALFETARIELTDAELGQELKLAVDLAGSAIVPCNITLEIVGKMIALTVAKVLGYAARAA